MRTALVVAIVLLEASIVVGQTTAPSIDPDVILEGRITAIERQLGILIQSIDRLAAHQSRAAPVGADDITTFQSQVETRLDALERGLRDLVTGGQVGIATSPASDLVSAMEKDSALRDSLFRATNGRFEVHNQMGVPMSVRLNGQRWQFPAGISSISVPVGEVQVQLVDGGDRHTFDQHDWRLREGRYVLKMGITTQLPIQE